MREIILTRNRILRYASDCFDRVPSGEEIQMIAEEYNNAIDKYGELYEGEVIDIIADVLEVY